MDQAQARFVELALSAVDRTNRGRWWEVSQPDVGEALFTRLIINLYDALKILKTDGVRIGFTADIDGGEDLHELVRNIRNSACHIGSGERLVRGSSLAFIMVIGLNPRAMDFGDLVLGNPYADDVAVYYGARRIYLHRHIARASREATAELRRIAARDGLRLLNLSALG